MEKKILIIGQALPAVEQRVPYDTTQLYDWLNECGITKLKAQTMFDFDAVYDKFPGYEGASHKIPTYEQMLAYYHHSLCHKLQTVNKVIILGNVAKDFLMSTPAWDQRTIQKLYLIHPSKRNYDRYIKNKQNIIQSLKDFINYEPI